MHQADNRDFYPIARSTLGWQPAGFYRSQGDGLLCTLCPHACVLADGEIGQCQVRRRHGSRLETATFATSVRHLDTIERKPFYHYRPGHKVLTLAAPGCSFTCLYCQNYRLSQFGRTPAAPWRAQPVEVASVIAEAVAKNAAVALSYSEPSLAAELTLALAAAGRPQGVEIVWKTNGFLTAEALAQIGPSLSAVNVDLKTVDAHKHKALTGAPVGPVLEAIAGFIAAGVWVEISTPLIPKFNADSDSLRNIAAAVREPGPHIPWHLLRFTPEYRLRRAKPTPPEVLNTARAIAREAGLYYVYVERACGPAARNTFCPQCGEEVVRRDIWATRAVSLVNGACPQCGFAVFGYWD
ncbi:MAG: AmmeMemoRadiSam system radical SAM enzyme [Candidatus Competibacteraceae bacterium]